MPPVSPYGPYGQQGGYPQQPQQYQPAPQTPLPYGGYGGALGRPASPPPGATPSFSQLSYQQPAAAPYGPPPAQPQPFYGNQAPGMNANVPHDPYAWQRAAVQPAAAQPQFQPQPRSAMQSPMSPQAQAFPSAYGPAPQPRPAQTPFASSAATQPPAYGQMAYQSQPASSPVQQPFGQQAYGQRPGRYSQPANPMNQFAQSAQQGMPMQQAYGPQQPAYGNYRQRPPRRGLSGILGIFKNKRAMAAGGVVAAALVVVIGLTAATSGGGSSSSSLFGVGGGSGSKLSPEELFQTALSNSLQIKSYSQKLSSANRTVVRNIDVSDIKTPRISGTASLKDTKTELTAYASLNDTFVKLSQSSMLSKKPSLANKWVQVRKGGASLDTSGTGGTSLDLLFTPTTALYGGFIFGNYSTTDQANLLGIIKDQLVYRFDPTQTAQATVNGQAVTQYKVTVSASGQQALLTKAAQLAGVDQKRIAEAAALARLSGSANNHLNVSVSNDGQRIVQVAEDGANDPETADFSGFGETKVDKVPAVEYSWDVYAKLLAN